MVSQPELFAGIDYGTARPSLTKARALVAEIEAFEEYDGSDFLGHCEQLAGKARRMGAHSVARALRWAQRPDVFERISPDAVDIACAFVARRWLARLERSA